MFFNVLVFAVLNRLDEPVDAVGIGDGRVTGGEASEDEIVFVNVISHVGTADIGDGLDVIQPLVFLQASEGTVSFVEFL